MARLPRATATLALALGLVQAGCEDIAAPAAFPLDPTNPEVSFAVDASRAPDDHTRPAEMPSIRIARKVPEFGGFHFDSLGNLHVYLTGLDRPGPRAAAADMLRELHDEARSQSRSPGGTVIFHPARYRFAELRQWRDTIFGAVFSIDGVSSLSIDPTLNRIKVGIDPSRSDARAAVESVLGTRAVPRDAVVLNERIPSCEPPRILCDEPPPPYEPVEPVGLTSAWTSLRAGIRVTSESKPWGHGTLGFSVAYCEPPNYFCRNFFAVTSHQTRRYAAVDPDEFFQQPEVGQGGRRLQEELDPPWTQIWFPIDPKPDRGWGYTCAQNLVYCRRSDMALLLPLTGYQFGVIARPMRRFNEGEVGMPPGMLDVDPGNPTIRVAGERGVFRGDLVDRIGQKTGWRIGRIEEVCVDLSRILNPDPARVMGEVAG